MNRSGNNTLNQNQLEAYELLSRYLIKEVSKEEAAKVEALLNEDPEFFELYKMTLEDLQEMDAEMPTSVDLNDAEMDELHKNILKGIGQNSIDLNDAITDGLDKNIPEDIKTKPSVWPWQRIPWQRMVAAATIFLSSLPGYMGYVHWNTGMRIAEVREVQEENYIQRDSYAFLSGDYVVSTGLMSVREPDRNIQELEKAITFRDKDDDTEAYIRLLHEYILTDQEHKLSDVLAVLEAVPHKSYQLLNDLGCGYARIGENETALKYFKQACGMIEQDNRCYFNMALSYVKLGEIEKARESLEKFIQLENNLGRLEAAKKKLRNLPKSK